MSAPDLERFVAAQAAVIDDVRAELTAGRKRTHWMWFVFPQLRGLGASPTARHYALGSRDEACAFLVHPVLGPRLRECAALVNRHGGTPIRTIFGTPDDLKFRSSATLFARAAPDEAVFRTSLDLFFGGEPDARTLALLG